MIGNGAGMDILPSSSKCLGRGHLWQNTGNVVDGLWYGTLAVGSAGFADVASGAAWLWAGSLGPGALAASPTAYGAILLGQEFLAGWNGQYAPTWANAAGAAVRRIIACPPWEAITGSCG